MVAALKPCKSCGRDVAPRAGSCPHCGQARPAGGVPRGVVWGTFSIGILLLAWFVAGSLWVANSFVGH